MGQSTLLDNPTSDQNLARLDDILQRCEGAYSPRSLKGYECDLRCFAGWCDDRLAGWLPADARTVADFIDDQIPMHRLATIKRRVVAIAFAHRILSLPNPTEHSAVRLALRRARRTKPQRPEQTAGLTYDLVAQVLARNCTTLAAYRDTALVAVGYDSLSRSSELAAMRVEHLRNQAGRISGIVVPRSKADIAGDGRIAHFSPATAQRLDEWLRASNISKGPLFQGLHLARPSGRRLHTSSIPRMVRRVLESAGLPRSLVDRYSGHSMRIGAAQDMMVAGLDILAIMQAGGWTTPHVAARYVEKASSEQIHQRRWSALAAMSG